MNNAPAVESEALSPNIAGLGHSPGSTWGRAYRAPSFSHTEEDVDRTIEAAR